MGRKNKGGKELAQTKDKTPLLPLSGTRKVVRTPTNPFYSAGTVEVLVPKEIIARRIQDIFAGSNKVRKADHYLVVWEGYPLKKDYTWEPIENLYGHEDLAQTYEQWLKTENERLDSQEAERKTARVDLIPDTLPAFGGSNIDPMHRILRTLSSIFSIHPDRLPLCFLFSGYPSQTTK